MNNLLNSLAIFLSLFTATGVLVHEAHIDRLATASNMSRKNYHASASPDLTLGSDPHTHSTHGGRTLNGFTYKTPTVPPRETKYKRYLMQNVEPQGRHAFDNSNLPVIA